MYAKSKFSNTLRQKFHVFHCCQTVKVKLFSAYFSNVYMCALWVNYRKTTFHQFLVAYNNSYQILNRLPMRCSASGMFATDNANSCTCVIRKSIWVIPCQINQWFVSHPSDFDEMWHTCRQCLKKSVQIFRDVGQAVSEIWPSKKQKNCRFFATRPVSKMSITFFC